MIMRRTGITNRDVERWAQQYKEGHGLGWIAANHHSLVSDKTVGNHLKAAGVELRTRGSANKADRHRKIAELKAAGVSTKSICERFGIKPAQVQYSARIGRIKNEGSDR